MDVKDLLKGVNIQDLIKKREYPVHEIKRPNDAILEAVESVRRRKEEEIQIQKDIATNTKRTADNTEWLSQSVNLIRINNERQTELLEIITEILALSNENDKVAAEGKLKDILNKVQGFKDNYELIMFLKEFGSSIITVATTGNV